MASTDDQASDLELMALARSNEDFRREVVTGGHMQMVVMTIPPGEEIGEETHHGIDQMLLFVDGRGESVLEGRRAQVTPGQMVFVPAGTLHNFINTDDVPLRLITAYAPPEHAPGTVHATKAEADAAEHDH